MKIRVLGVVSLFVGVSLFVINCGSKSSNPSSPSGPSGPANTATVTDSPTITLSPTQTGTPTLTGTPTVTRTPTNTTTVTDTPTATNSATNSPTPTFTGTPTNSATSTETATITDTATLTLTLTETLSPTPTGTPTNTATITSTNAITNTRTATSTITVTTTSTPAYSISGTVNYTGSLASVSAGNPLILAFTDSSNFSGSVLGETTITANGGSYSFAVPTPGNYYMVALLNKTTLPPCQLLNAQTTTSQGSPHEYYGGSCTSSTDTAINVTGNQTGVNFTFGDTCPIDGVSGTIAYTGSKGSVSATNPLIILTFSDGTYTVQKELPVTITCNSTSYNRIVYNESAEYQLAFYDLAGNGTLSAGDPFIEVGAFTPGTAETVPISFDDSNIYSATGYSITGTLNYAGSDVSITTGHPAIIYWSTSSDGSSPTLGATVTSNGGSYGISLPSAGTYYLIAAIGAANDPPCESLYSFQGGIYQFYGGSCSSSTAINVTGNTTGANFSFGDSCGQLTGVSGGVTYTGSLATISNTNAICIENFSDATYSTRVGPEYNVRCNDTTYSFGTGGTSPLYQEAFVVLDGNYAGPDAGDPYIQLGPFTPSTSVVVPITFNDANLALAPYTLTGTVTYQGAGSNSVYVILGTPGGPGGLAISSAIANGGTYSFTGLTFPAQLIAVYDNTGNGLEDNGSLTQGNGTGLTGSGDVLCSVGYTGVTCPRGAGAATTFTSSTTENIVFGGSTGQSGTSCTY
jgi:hypothetical protein